MPVRASLKTYSFLGEMPEAERRELFAAILDHRLYLQQVTGHSKEPLRRVDLDTVLPAVSDLSLDYDVYARASSGKLRVAVEVADDLRSPRRSLAGLWIHAPVQVYTGEWVAAREHKAKSAVLLATSQSFIGLLERGPPQQVGGGSLPPGFSRVRDLLRPLAHCLPHHPLRTDLELFGDSLYLD